VAFRVTDLGKSSAFYENLLGYAEPFSLSDRSGRANISVVKINDQQYIELLQGDLRSRGQFDHLALYTDDLPAIRRLLVSQRIPILLDIHRGRTGNPFLTTIDPDGHLVEILQYLSTSLTAQSRGQFMPASRVSSHLAHVGIAVASPESAMKFYQDVLGFREFSGVRNGQPGQIFLQVGAEYIELLALKGAPSPAYLRSQNHVALEVTDVRQTVDQLQSRASGFLTSAIEVQTGGGLPRRANLYDPDGVRIELMESLPAGLHPSELKP